MNRLLKIATIILIVLSLNTILFAENQVNIDQRLESVLKDSGNEDYLPLVIVLNNPVPGKDLLRSVQGMTLRQRREFVISTLKERFSINIRSLEKWLDNQKTSGNVKNVQPLWICNAYTFSLRADKFDELTGISNISHILYDAPRHSSEITDELDEEIEVITDDTDRISDGVELIDAPAVWELGIEGRSSIVGLMDTGVDYNHTDLQDHIWINEDEIPGNGIDDDENGYIDDINGWNFVTNTASVQDIQGHGTKSAGVIAGDGTAGDTTGVAPKARIMILRIYEATSNSNSRMLLAIQYGIENGANIMASSISYDWVAEDPFVDYVLQRQTQEALLAAGLIQANSTGNDGDHLTTYPIPWNISAPANCPPPWHHPDQTLIGGLSAIIAVGSGDENGTIPSYSDYGPSEWNDAEYPDEYQDYPWNDGEDLGLIRPDVVAPRSVRTTRRYGGYYSSYNGTSASSPHVSGTLALLHDAHQQATPEQLAEAIMMSATDFLEEGKDNRSGCGMINAYNALMYLDDITTTGGLEIYVHDGHGSPITNAFISCSDGEVVGWTGNNGLASLNRIIVGTYDITISADGYEDYVIEDVDIVEDQIEELVVPLEDFYFLVDPQVVNTTMLNTDTLDLSFYLDSEGFEGALFELSLEPLSGLDWENDNSFNIFDEINSDYQVDAVSYLDERIVVAGYNGTEVPKFYSFDLDGSLRDSTAQPLMFGDEGLSDWALGNDGNLLTLARGKIFMMDSELDVADSLDFTIPNAYGLAYNPDNDRYYISYYNTVIEEYDNQGNILNTWNTEDLIRSIEYHKDDYLGESLYMLLNSGDGFATISRLNLETGVISEVTDLAPDSLDMGLALGLTDSFKKPYWTLLTVQQSGVRILNREVKSQAYSLVDTVRCTVQGANVDLSIYGPMLPISNYDSELALVWHHVENNWDYRIPIIIHVDENSLSGDNNTRAENFELLSAWPNPFNSSVRLTVNIQNNTQTKLAVYNILGQKIDTVYDGKLATGLHSFTWNAAHQASGIYFAVLSTKHGTKIRKLLLTK